MSIQRSNQEGLGITRRRNKRAGLVCSRCHEKKIKCDLQAIIGQERESPRCRNCIISNSVCQVRSSRRATGRRTQHAIEASNQRQQQQQQQQQEHVLDDLNSPDSSRSALPVLARRDDVSSPPTALRQLLHVAAEEHSAHFQEDGLARSLRPHATHSADLAQSQHAVFTPGQTSSSSRQHQQQPSYLGESGYMQIFSRENGAETTSPQDRQLCLERSSDIDAISPALRDGYWDTYFQYAHVWCPVIDQETLLVPHVAESLLLRHAVALCGNQIRPPLLEPAPSAAHYNRAKSLFYANYEASPVLRISALMLFYWWSAGPPNIVSMDTSWWWTGAAIRLAQEIGLHREPHPGQIFPPGENAGLRRRIWWTLFARERIAAVAQGRPCIIDTDYCDVRMISHEDFANPADIRAEVFIQWIRLSEIIGRIGKRLCRRVEDVSSTTPLAMDLINWVQSLPPLVQVELTEGRQSPFNRDVHGLHLVYFATIALLNLSKSAAPSSLPKASITAIAAASYIAQIFEDYLARGSVRFLAGQTAWYIAVAILALLDARHVESLTAHAERDIRSLRVALKQMAELWHSAKMFDLGFDKLLSTNPLNRSIAAFNQDAFAQTPGGQQSTPGSIRELTSSVGDMNWLSYFPNISSETSPLIRVLLANNRSMPFEELQWPMDFTAQLHGFFASPADFNFDFQT